MCRKTIYYNTYGDGAEDVTERISTCRPGKVCPHPERREYRRQFRFSKVHVDHASSETPSSLADRKPTPYSTDFLELPPTPRSKSPSPSRKHESGVYVNGAKVADIHTPRKEKRPSHRVVIHAPEPPSPRPILKRSSTMPSEYVVVEDNHRGRHGRDHREHPRRRTSSKDVLLGPVRIADDLGSHYSNGSRRSASPRPNYYRSHDRSPREYSYVDEERERKRALRRHSTLYANGSDFSRADSNAVFMTPATSAVRKELRWEDQVQASIARQNQRIAQRPKVYQEPKGILKKDSAAVADTYDELRKAVGKMDIHPSTRRDGDDPKYWDRLRDRFEEPRDRRRRSRVYYPGEGLYKYM